MQRWRGVKPGSELLQKVPPPPPPVALLLLRIRPYQQNLPRWHSSQQCSVSNAALLGMWPAARVLSSSSPGLATAAAAGRWHRPVQLSCPGRAHTPEPEKAAQHQHLLAALQMVLQAVKSSWQPAPAPGPRGPAAARQGGQQQPLAFVLIPINKVGIKACHSCCCCCYLNRAGVGRSFSSIQRCAAELSHGGRL